MNLTSTARVRVSLLIFALSGFAGLIYQSIWSHYLGLLLGHSSYAQVLVLALFMGGMAIGAWITSRRSVTIASPIRIYAYVEFGLGVFGIGFHSVYLLASSWAYSTLFPLVAPGLQLELARWGVASVLILPQCILLGATFPLMSAGFVRWQPSCSGNILAGLYFSNSIGATLGALASTFLLLPAVGLPGTVLSAGLVNILVAIVVWPLSKENQPNLQALTSRRSSDDRSLPLFILIAAGITGASSFMYEVSWVRMLAMVLGGTIHAFELMLATFIAGIAVGGLWLRNRADRLASPRRAAGYAQIAMGCMALSTLAMYNQSFSWIAWAIQTLNRSVDSAYTAYNLASIAISAAIMFPTAFFAGMTLPLLTLVLLKDGYGESSIGRAYSANTLGAIFGVMLAIGLALPLLGLRVTLWLAAAADIVLGALLLINFGVSRSGGQSISPIRPVTFAIASGFGALGLSLGFTHFDRMLMSSAVFRSGKVVTSSDSSSHVIFQKDGRTATVSLVESDSGVRSILTNGKPDAAIGMNGQPTGDEITMLLTGILPMLHNPAARNVAIVGFGSGMTTHVVLGNTAIESVETIEIEPAMVEAARLFQPKVARAYADPRSKILIDDAKSFITTNRRKYDVIISEPSNPWVNGVASLFTNEFYAFIPQHLNDDGVFAQWIQAYELSPQLMNSIINAMLPHFADIKLYSAGPADWLLIASPRRKLSLDAGFSLPSSWTPELRQELRIRGVETGREISMLFAGNRNVLTHYSSMYPASRVNSDFFPVLQLGSAKTRFSGAWASELLKLRLADWPVFEVMAGAGAESIFASPTPFFVQNIDLARAIRRAQRIHAMLTGLPDPYNEAYQGLAERFDIRYLRATAACEGDSTSTDDLLVLTKLAARTIPYLNREVGTQLWRRTELMKCVPKATVTKNVLTFIRAIASRNYSEAWTIGRSITADPEQLKLVRRETAVLEYLVGGMQLAAMASGRSADALRVEQQLGAELQGNFSRSFMLQAALNDLARRLPTATPD